MMNSYTILRGKHKGANAFIFGAGPSLWYNMHEPFFPDIPKYGITISVNSSVMAVPDFDYWVSNDALCLRWSWWENVKRGRGTKVVRSSWSKYRKHLKDFLFFEPRPTDEGTVKPEDVGLCYCSSVPSSIDLALQMGCKKIFVFGLDHHKHRGNHHYWQFMPKPEQPVCKPMVQDKWDRQKSVFNMNLLSFSALKKYADQEDVKIYNVNWIEYGRYLTKVKEFKRIDINSMRKLL